jgi:4-amino-4-deoxy-L-arabinose transferase-like glycosyltransferase
MFSSLRARFPHRLRQRLVPGTLGVTLVAICVRLPLLGTTYSAPDSGYYLVMAKNVFHHGYLSDLRPPGYTTLLAVFELVGLNPADTAVVFQNLVGMVLPAFVLLVGARFFTPLVGILAGFLTAASPLMISIEQFVLTDYLFSVLLFVAAVVLAEAVLRLRGGGVSWPLLVAAGAIFGLATLFRANGIFALLAIPLALLIGAPGKSAFRASAIAMGALALVVAPWCVHNLIRFGDFSVASESGLSLYGRAVSYDQVRPQADTPGGRLALQIYNTANPEQEEAVVATTGYVFNALVFELGMDPNDALGEMEALARQAIRNDPGIYLRNTLQILGRYQGVYYPRTWTTRGGSDQISLVRDYVGSLDPSKQKPPGESALTRWPWEAAQALTQALFFLTLGGLLILVMPFLGESRSRAAACSFLAVGIVGLIGVSLTARFELRHGVVFAPFVWILAPAAVVAVARLFAPRLTWLRSRLRTRHAIS